MHKDETIKEYINSLRNNREAAKKVFAGEELASMSDKELDGMLKDMTPKMMRDAITAQKSIYDDKEILSLISQQNKDALRLIMANKDFFLEKKEAKVTLTTEEGMT